MNRRQRAAALKWLDSVTAPLQKDHPGALMGQLVELLSEPDRTRGRAIMAATAPPGLSIERVNRKPWHRAIEVAISIRIRSDDFNMNDILEAAGIDQNAAEYPAALRYASDLVAALTYRPAGAGVPVLVPQQSDKPQ